MLYCGIFIFYHERVNFLKKKLLLKLHLFKGKKPDAKDHSLHASTYMKCVVEANSRVRKWRSGCLGPGLGAGGPRLRSKATYRHHRKHGVYLQAASEENGQLLGDRPQISLAFRAGFFRAE